MTKRKFLAPLAAVAMAVAVILGGIVPAFAATNGSAGNGLRVSPVRTDLTINPGSSKTVDVTLTNLTSETATYKVIINDFTAGNDESGTPAIILNPKESAPSHGLKQFIEPVSNVTVSPNQQKDIKVRIDIPAKAAGGGYFGAVRFAPVSAPSGKNVSLSASVASLILVKVPGDIKEQMSVVGFTASTIDPKNGSEDTRTFFTSPKNINAVVRFKNSGNVQEAPFGKVVVKKGGKQIAEYEINNSQQPGEILPDSVRKFAVPLPAVKSIGKYTVEGNFGYGANGQLLSASTTFYVVPWWALVIFALIILLIILAIVLLPRFLRNYNKRHKFSRKASRS